MTISTRPRIQLVRILHGVFERWFWLWRASILLCLKVWKTSIFKSMIDEVPTGCCFNHEGEVLEVRKEKGVALNAMSIVLVVCQQNDNVYKGPMLG